MEERELPLWELMGYDIDLFLFCFVGTISPLALGLAAKMGTLFLN